MSKQPYLRAILVISCWFLAGVAARADLSFTYHSPEDVAVSASGYSPSGALELTLQFEPRPGQNLTVVRNTGPAFLAGRFEGVAQGGEVSLTYAGVRYPFVANYYGGNGRSLVLHWPLARVGSWGSNAYGQLGDGIPADQAAPVPVDQRGVMAGVCVTSVDAGMNHSLALGSDGRVFAWGDNHAGQLGNGGLVRSRVPVAVVTGGSLAGKTVVAVSAGGDFSLALDEDGRVHAWGSNTFGNLGNGGTEPSSVPVAVDAGGVLAGKTITAIAAGPRHALALGSDGKVYAWGTNAHGALGNSHADGTFVGSSVPVEVDDSGVLSGKTIVAIEADEHTSYALSSEGRVYAWGANSFRQLGNGGTESSAVPVAVDGGSLAGRVIVAIASSPYRSLALDAEGRIHTWGSLVATADGSSLSGGPYEVDTGAVLAGKVVTGLCARTSRCSVLTADGILHLWQQNDSSGGLVPMTGRGDLAGRWVSLLTGGATHGVALLDGGAPVLRRQPLGRMVREGGTATFSARAWNEFPSTVRWQVSTTGPQGDFVDLTGNPSASSEVLTLDGVSSSQHGHAFRAVFSHASGQRASRPAILSVVDWSATLRGPAEVPFSAEAITASGPIDLQLGFAPAPGSTLTIVENRGAGFISGRFSNLPQGGSVILTHNSVDYPFVADYHGGNGRSLVLRWARTRLMAWGENELGRLGTGDADPHLVPAEVVVPPALAGRIRKVAAAGGVFSMALTDDGSLFTWGNNRNGRLGTLAPDGTGPVEVTAGGALAGKEVVDISANGHCLAVTSEGRVYAWGLNNDRQLGTGSTEYSVTEPVELAPAWFDGEAVVAVRAGGSHSMALTADGRVFAWGSNASGKTGNGQTTWFTERPTEIIPEGHDSDVSYVAIAAGGSHSLALAGDGRLFAWGDRSSTGTGSSASSVLFPTPVIATGALAGRSLRQLEAGWHSLVLAGDGSLIGWGTNYHGQLGTGTNTDVPLPMRLDGGALSGRFFRDLACSGSTSAVVTADGGMFAWGENGDGQLGDGTKVSRNVAAAVSGLGGPDGLRAMSIAAGGNHMLAVVDAGPPRIVSQPSAQSASEGVDVAFSVIGEDPYGFEIQWQASPAGTAGPFADVTGNPTAHSARLVLEDVHSGQHGWAWRAVLTNVSGTTFSDPALLHVVDWSGEIDTAGLAANRAENPVIHGALELDLRATPAAGSSIVLLENTGLAAIEGSFSNLPHGGRITLRHAGTDYEFIANYAGGNGRSLVLQWPWMKLAAAGSNTYFQLGRSGIASSGTPLVLPSGTWSSGRSILSVSAGANHNLAVMSDGRIAAWGRNQHGQLGDGSTTSRAEPLDVAAGGAIAGETVVVAAAGESHSLALTRAGRVFAWGSNASGQLGDGTNLSRTEPVEVEGLGGRSIVAIACGAQHSLALSREGLVYAWGSNASGELGNNRNTPSLQAMEVVSSGVLAGKRIVAIAAGGSNSLARDSEGRLYAWGSASFGALGHNHYLDSKVPVIVGMGSGLAGRPVLAMAVGTNFSLALSAEERLFGWGLNNSNQFGDSQLASSQMPVEIPPLGERVGRVIRSISTGSSHSLAVTDEGRLLAWGPNSSGQLGLGNTAQQAEPGLSLLSSVQSAAAGHLHSLAMIAGSAKPEITANPADVKLILAGSATTTLRFSAAALDALPLQVRWQVSAYGPAGPFSDITGNASAATPTLELDEVSPSLDGYAYRAVFSHSAASATTSAAVLRVTTVPGSVHFTSPSQVPIQGDDAVLAGEIQLSLGYAPQPGDRLTLVRNSGGGFLSGAFSNLVHGSKIQLPFAGRTHSFVVDFHGGNGRSLVLAWADTLAAGWGGGSSGQVGGGNNFSTIRSPEAVQDSGAMAGETLLRLAAGSTHSLALAASGRVFAWGNNSTGSLGDGTTTASNTPVEVDPTGFLAGKTAVAIAAGSAHSLVLTSDGQVAAWGSNSHGQLGIGGSSGIRSTPVAVALGGVLAGKTVTAIAAGSLHSVALLSDGTLAAWGSNLSGQIGTGGNGQTALPVAVLHGGALAGRRIIAIAAGGSHTLALASDGRVFSWGGNQFGQLGRGSAFPSSSSSPAAIAGDGLVAGQAVIAIAAGAYHSLALTADGRVYAWGQGGAGELGTGSSGDQAQPVAVSTAGVLAGRTVVAISAGEQHSLALDSGGRAYAWGSNRVGQLGDASLRGRDSRVPLIVQGGVATRPFTWISAGASHSLAIAGRGTAPAITRSPDSITVTADSTVIFRATADGYPAPTVQWQRSLSGPSGPFTNLAGQTGESLSLNGVTASQTGQAYRAVFTNLEASTPSSAASLIVRPTLDGFLVSRGLQPGAAPLDDPYQTGIPHVLAYALDLDPAAPDHTKLPAAHRAEGRLRISYTRWKYAADLRYTVEAGDGLADWQSGPGITETVSVTPIDPARENVIEQEILPGPSATRFLRLRVDPLPP